MSFFLFVILSLCGTCASLSTTKPTPFSRLQGSFRVVATTTGDSEGTITEEVVADHNSVAVLRLDSFKLHEPTHSVPLTSVNQPWSFDRVVSVDDVEYNKFILDSQEFLNTSHPLYGLVYAGEIPHVFEYLEDMNGIPYELAAKNTLSEGVSRYESSTRFHGFNGDHQVETSAIEHLQAKYEELTLARENRQLQGLPFPKDLDLHFPSSCNVHRNSTHCVSFSGHSKNGTYKLDLGAVIQVKGSPVNLDLNMDIQEEPLAVTYANGTGGGCTFIYGSKVLGMKLGIDFCLKGQAFWQKGGKAEGEIAGTLSVNFGPAREGRTDKVGVIGDEKGFKGVYGDLTVSTSEKVVGVSAGFELDVTTVNYDLHEWYGVGNLHFEAFVGLGLFKKTFKKSPQIFETSKMHIR